MVLGESVPPVQLILELLPILRMNQLQRTLVDDVGLKKNEKYSDEIRQTAGERLSKYI